MVGTAPDGQLTAARRDKRVRFAVAGPEHDAAIRQLLRTPMHGAIAVAFEREPDYFRGAAIAGATDRTIVAFEDDRLVCMGRCSLRRVWINGAERTAGYLGELRLASSAAGRFDILRRGYGFFRQLAERETTGDGQPPVWFTSIATDNTRARRLLERGLRRLPTYLHVGDLTTLLIPAARPRRRLANEFDRSSAARLGFGSACPAELAAFLNETGARHQFAAAWTAERIEALARHDLPLGEFGVVRQGGSIVAAAALWDQRRFRQTVVRGYSPPLRWSRPLLNLGARLLGFPRLPDPGSVLPLAFLSPLGVRAGHEALLPSLVAGFRHRAAAQGIEHLALALPSQHAGIAALRRGFRPRTYSTLLYTVSWPGDAEPALDGRPVLPDVALL